MKPAPLDFRPYRRRCRPNEIREAARLDRNRRVQNIGGRSFIAQRGDYLVRIGGRVQRVVGEWFEQIYEKAGDNGS